MPPEAPPAAPAPASVTPETFVRDAAAAEPKSLNELLRHDPRAKVAAPTGALVPATPPPAAAPPPPATPPPATPPPATPPVAAAVPPAIPPASAPPADVQEADAAKALELAKNWRLQARDLKEAQFFSLIRQGKSPQEATAEVYGTAPAPAAAPAAATPPRVEAPPAPNTAEIDAQITAAETALNTLATQVETALDKEADTKTALKLKDQQLEKRLELERLRTQREGIIANAEQSAIDARVSKYQQARAESQRLATEAFPSLAVETSPERALFNQRCDKLRGDPDRAAIFQSPDWPQIVASQLAVEQGWVKATPGGTRQPPAAAAPPAAIPPPPPASSTRATAAEVITPGDPAAGTSFVPTLENLREAAGKADPKDLNKLLAGQTPRIARR